MDKKQNSAKKKCSNPQKKPNSFEADDVNEILNKIVNAF